MSMTRPYQKVFLPKCQIKKMPADFNSEVLEEMNLDENVYGEVDLGTTRNHCKYDSGRYVYKNHVYHEVSPPSNSKDEKPSIKHHHRKHSPPPVPYKPHYLRSFYVIDTTSPPVPPRVVNKTALIQRNQLNEEYFENIRKTLESEHSDDANDDTAQSISVKIPGTERRPYWTIEDVRKTHQPKISDKVVASYNTHNDLKLGSLSMPSASKLHSRLHDHSRSEFFTSLKMLKKCGWYWGDMGWEEAELLLNQREPEEGKLCFC